MHENRGGSVSLGANSSAPVPDRRTGPSALERGEKVTRYTCNLRSSSYSRSKVTRLWRFLQVCWSVPFVTCRKYFFASILVGPVCLFVRLFVCHFAVYRSQFWFDHPQIFTVNSSLYHLDVIQFWSKSVKKWRHDVTKRQKHLFGHNFWTERSRELGLSSYSSFPNSQN